MVYKAASGFVKVEIPAQIFFGVTRTKQSGGKIRIATERLVLSTWVLGLILICAPAARAHSPAESVLHSFAGTDGEYPSGVIQGSNGNFYGTTYEGGSIEDAGTVFELTPSGTLTTLYSFCSQASCTDGNQPNAGVIQGIDGNFYGTTEYGGANQSAFGGIGGGTVFKLTPSGTLTTLYSFCGQANCIDGERLFAGVIEGTDGNFYGTTWEGGANNSGTVFELTPSGELTILHSFCSQAGCTDGAYPYASLIQASDGNFYGTTFYAGTGRLPRHHLSLGDGTVFELTPSGTLTTLYSFCTHAHCTDGKWPYAGVIQGDDGNFYGTTQIGGPHNDGTVFQLTPSGRLTTLHSFCSHAHCADGKWPYAGVIQGSDGNLYGTTEYGGRHHDGTVFEVRAGHVKAGRPD